MENIEKWTHEKPSPISNAVLVDTSDVDPKTVLKTTPDHKAKRLTRLDGKIDLPRSGTITRRVTWMKWRWRCGSSLTIHPTARLLTSRAWPNWMSTTTSRIEGWSSHCHTQRTTGFEHLKINVKQKIANWRTPLKNSLQVDEELQFCLSVVMDFFLYFSSVNEKERETRANIDFEPARDVISCLSLTQLSRCVRPRDSNREIPPAGCGVSSRLSRYFI